MVLLALFLPFFICTEFIEPGASMEWRRDRTGQKNILFSCPAPPRLHARSRLYEFGVLLALLSLLAYG